MKPLPETGLGVFSCGSHPAGGCKAAVILKVFIVSLEKKPNAGAANLDVMMFQKLGWRCSTPASPVKTANGKKSSISRLCSTL